MGFSITQQKFNDAFIFRANSLIDELFAAISNSPNWLDEFEAKLDQGSALAGGVAATLGIGVAAAPVTGGLSLAAAGAIIGVVEASIVITKLASGGYRFMTQVAQDDSSADITLEVTLDEHKLFFKIIMQEVADILMVRYRNFIDEIVEVDGIAALAYFGAEQVIKELKKQLLAQLKAQKSMQATGQSISFNLNPYDLVNILTKSEPGFKIKALEKVKVKAKYAPSSIMASSNVPIKWVYMRPRVVNFTNILGNLSLNVYKSKKENTHFSSSGTLPQYGYASVDDLGYISQRGLVEHSMEADELTEISESLCFYYEVSVEELEEYLTEARGFEDSQKPSLNDFLSAKYAVQLIAACHDDRLKHLDLSGGNFAEVNFRGVTLSGNLDNTKWVNARLVGAKFLGANLTSNTNFNNAFLENTEWQGLELVASLINAKMNGAQIRSCVFGELRDIGCNWELAHIDENCTHPMSSGEWRELTEQRLTAELNARQQIADVQYQEYLAWQIEQQERWEAQEKLNADHSRKIDLIQHRLQETQQQPVLDVLNTIREQGLKYHDETLSEPYINLNLLPAGIANTAEDMSLTERLLRFLRDPLELFFLLHGAIGSGKTVAVTRFHQEMLLYCHSQSDIYPIFIKLKHVQASTSSNFLEQCLLTQFDHAQIDVLKKNFTCLVILDGLEDSGISIDDRYIVEECLAFNQDCLQGSWKVLFSASTQYLLESSDYRERMRWSPIVNFPFESEYSILPLNHRQIDCYIDTYYQGKVYSSGISPADLYAMAQTPVMLHLMCEVLSELSIEGSPPRSKTDFYQAFLNNWSMHVLQKSGTQRLKARSILIFLQDFAYQMFTEDRHHVEWPIEDDRDALEIERDSDSCQNMHDFGYLFNNPLWKKAGTIAPLKVTRDDFRQVMVYQIRPPFRMFALANKLFGLLRRSSIQEVIRSWNYAYLADSTNYSVFESLAELVVVDRSKEVFINVLCQMVDASCGSDGHLYSKAASNAITLLNYMEYDFSANLAHDRWRGLHIKKANLRYGKFAGFDFSDGDLEDTKWQYAELIGVNMDRALTKGAVFFDGMSVIHTKKHPEVFAVYPADEPIIAYSVLKRLGSEEREIIIVGAKGKKYPKISGHQTEIKSLAWGVSNTEPPVAYLASASVHGTIRVWSVNEQRSKQIACFKVDSEDGINSISWYKDGDLIVSGSDDNRVRIWSIFTRKLIFVYDLQSRVNSVIFGRDEKLMLAVDDRGRLNLWDMQSLRRGVNLIQPPQLQVEPLPGKGRALSTAMAVPERYVAVGYENGDIVTFSLGIQRESNTQPANITASIDKVLQKHTGPVNSIVWNAYCLVSGSEDGLVIVWDPLIGVSLAVYQGDGIPVRQVAWLMGGRQVVTGQDRKLSIYDPDYLPDTKDDHGQMNTIIKRVAPIDRLIAMGDVSGKVWLWDIGAVNDKVIRNVYTHSAEIIDLAWSVDKRYLASHSIDGIIKIVDAFNLQHEAFELSLDANILSIKWIVDHSDNPQKLVICTADRRVKFVSRNLTKEWEWQGFAGLTLGEADSLENLISIDFSKDITENINFFAAFIDNQVNVYSIENTQAAIPIYTLLPTDSRITLLNFSADNRYLLAKFANETIKIWDTDTWQEVWQDKFPSYEKSILWVVDVENRQWLLVATKDDLNIYQAGSDIRKVRRILKCVDNLAYQNGYLYLSEKKSVDMLDLSLLINGEDYARAFVTRFGYGNAVLGLNLTTAAELDPKTEEFAGSQGALIRRAEPKSLLQSTLLRAIGLHIGNYDLLPDPSRQSSTSQRVTHSFYRSNSAITELDSSSGADSPVKLVRDTSSGRTPNVSPDK